MGYGMRMAGALLGSMALASPALAECNNTATNRLCTDVQITMLVTSRDGSNSIKTSGDYNLLTCAPVPGGFFKLDMSGQHAQALYSHILAAHLQGKALSVRLSDHSATCTVEYVYSTN